MSLITPCNMSTANNRMQSNKPLAKAVTIDFK